MMHGRGRSDSVIVAVKPANKAERSAAEPVEPRAEAKANAGQQSTHRAQYRLLGARGNSRPYRDGGVFVAVLGGAMVAWPSIGQAQSGAEGHVLLGPTCPME